MAFWPVLGWLFLSFQPRHFILDIQHSKFYEFADSTTCWSKSSFFSCLNQIEMFFTLWDWNCVIDSTNCTFPPLTYQYRKMLGPGIFAVDCFCIWSFMKQPWKINWYEFLLAENIKDHDTNIRFTRCFFSLLISVFLLSPINFSFFIFLLIWIQTFGKIYIAHN